MNYNEFQNALTIRAVQAASPFTSLPPAFSDQIPRFIEYAENRIYRDFVFLAQRTQNATLAFTASSRSLNFSAITPILLVLEGVAMVTPVADQPSAGTRWQFEESSLDLIDSAWPQESLTLAPNLADNNGRYWAMKDDHTLVVAPTPDANYVAEITGIFRPLALSEANTDTYLSDTYPDILLQAAMIDVCAYLEEFGMASSDPQQAMSYEAQYQALKPGVLAEEQRRRGSGEGWSANMPAMAKPPRT